MKKGIFTWRDIAEVKLLMHKDTERTYCSDQEIWQREADLLNEIVEKRGWGPIASAE